MTEILQIFSNLSKTTLFDLYKFDGFLAVGDYELCIITMTKERKLELTRKIRLFGLNDLRKIAPIGDLGYANGWYEPFGDGSWMNGGLERAIMAAFYEQQKRMGYQTDEYSSGYRNTDHHISCKELGLSWSVDSSG